MKPIEFDVPIRVVSEANIPGHWKAGWARGKKQKAVVALFMAANAKSFRKPKKNIVVTLTRIIPPRGKVMDNDNAYRAFKSVRDSVAAYLGIDDGDPVCAWRCEQTRGAEHGIRIAIRKAD